MIVGPDCSVSTEPVAELALHWNLVQVSNTDIILYSLLFAHCYNYIAIAMSYIVLVKQNILKGNFLSRYQLASHYIAS